jgi:hypothetical protein
MGLAGANMMCVQCIVFVFVHHGFCLSRAGPTVSALSTVCFGRSPNCSIVNLRLGYPGLFLCVSLSLLFLSTNPPPALSFSPSRRRPPLLPPPPPSERRSRPGTTKGRRGNKHPYGRMRCRAKWIKGSSGRVARSSTLAIRMTNLLQRSPKWIQRRSG